MYFLDFQETQRQTFYRKLQLWECQMSKSYVQFLVSQKCCALQTQINLNKTNFNLNNNKTQQQCREITYTLLIK